MFFLKDFNPLAGIGAKSLVWHQDSLLVQLAHFCNHCSGWFSLIAESYMTSLYGTSSLSLYNRNSSIFYLRGLIRVKALKLIDIFIIIYFFDCLNPFIMQYLIPSKETFITWQAPHPPPLQSFSPSSW